jgi:kynurenine formamidase
MGEMRQAERFAGVRLEPGDAVLLRSGLDKRVADTGADGSAEPREGLVPSALSWLHERQVGLLCPDCVERLPSGYPNLLMPLHQIGLVAMGLVMVDGCDLELLTQLCVERRQTSFLLSLAPLRISGATGSPINPLVVSDRGKSQASVQRHPRETRSAQDRRSRE